MTSTGGLDRRSFVRALGSLATVSALAGCSGGGDGEDGSDGGDGATPSTEAPDPTETETETPPPQDESISAAVSAVNETITSLNDGEEASLASLNESFQNVEGVESIESVEATTADEAGQAATRLREERDRIRSAIVDKVPREINSRAPWQIVDPEPIETVEDLRAAAEDVGNEDASQALIDAADLAEHVTTELNAAADRLDSAGG